MMPADSPSGNGDSQPRRKEIGGFQILAKIGQGGMGAVFKARQVSMDRVVALKILPRRIAQNQRFVARFLREARAAARLSHPHIVHAIDAGQAEGYHYFAMEFVDGDTLLSRIRNGGRLPERQALEIARDVATALDYAHHAGIVHRDVKPGNILLAADGTVKLADLGLARETDAADSDITRAGKPIGTPSYVSPEQIRGETDVDGRADVYSLGATLYRLLVGARPYTGGTGTEIMAKHLTAPVPDPRDPAPGVSPGTAAIVQKAMAKDPADRYQNAKEMLNDITWELAVHEPGPGRPAAPTRPRRRLPPKRVYALAAGVAALILALAAVAFLLPGPAPHALAPAPPDPESPEAKDRALLGEARRWIAAHPGRYREGIGRLRDVLAALAAPDVRGEAEEALKTLERRADAADRAFVELGQAASRLREDADYDGAIAVYAQPPPAVADLLSDRAAAAAAALRREAESIIRAALGRARRHWEAAASRRGIAELDRIGHIRYEPGAAEVRKYRSVLVAENQSPNEATLRAAAAKLASTDRGDRVAAVWMFEKLRDRRAVGPLIAALGDTESEVRGPAASALGAFGDRRAVEPLLQALGDPERNVRLGAAWSLEKLADPRSFGAMVGALADDHWMMRQAAVQTLGTLGDRRAVEPLVAALGDRMAAIPPLAAKALDAMGWRPRTPAERAASLVAREKWDDAVKEGAAAVGPLLGAMKNRAELRRASAAAALARIGSPASPFLRAALTDGDPERRAAAAVGLGVLRDRRAVEPLIAALNDDEEWVRLDAAVALGRLGDRRAVEPLHKKLRDKSLIVRCPAAAAAARLGDRRGFAFLVAALRSDRRGQRHAAARELGDLGDPLAVPPLRAALTGETGVVRAGILRALKKLGVTVP